MTKKLLTLGILALILGGTCAPIAKAQTININPTAPINPINCPDGQVLAGNPPTCVSRTNLNNPTPTSAADLADDAGGAFSDWIVAPLFKAIGALLMKLSAGILTLAGKFFDFVVNFTIIDMAKYVSNPDGLGGSISDAWRTLRDIANMLFIFVLLFVAFNAMFELNFNNVGKSVTNIIIVALLINFSLFFSKVVIDASNIVSVGFYNSIITTNTATLGSGGEGGTATVGNQTISSGYMKLLGLQSWYDAKVLVDPKNTRADQILMIGILSSIFMLIAAVILIISAIMFATRFIILVFLMILSPVAFIAYILPGQEKHAREWWSALVNQSIFAPVFFALTWVSFKIASAPAFLGQQSILGGSNAAKFVDVGTKAPTPDSLMLVLNYVLVIGFAIGALVMAKRIASSAPGFTAISGGLGTGLIGGAAFAGRQTIGRGAKMLADSSMVRNAASSNKWYSGAAKASLWTADKGAKGTFDLRATDTLKKIPGLGKEIDILGKSTNKGGFAAAVDAKAKAKAQYAKDVYGQTEFEKEEFERRKKEEETQIKVNRGNKEAAARKDADFAEKKRKAYMNEQTGEFSTRLKTLNTQKKTKEEELKLAQDAGDKTKEEELSKDLGSIASRIANEREAKKEKEKEIEETDTDYKKLKEEADDKKEEAKEAKTRLKKKEIDDDELSEETQKLKKAAKERQEAFADRTRSGSPVSTSVGATVGAGIGSMAGPIGMAIGTAIGAGIGSTLGGKLPEKFNWAGNRAAAIKIKTEAGGKSKKERLADLAKEVAKDEDTTTTTTPPPTTEKESPKSTT